MNIEVQEANAYSETLIKEWEALLSRSGFRTPFHTPLWIEIWRKHFGGSLEAKVILFRTPEGTLVAVGAFSTLTGDGGEQGLTLLGSPDVCDYRDLVIASGREEEALGVLGRFFGEGPWGYLEFNGISEFSPIARFLPPLMQSLGFRVVQEVEEVALYLDLPPTWEKFLERLNSKDRHELRRKIRRMEREASGEISGVEGSLPLFRKMEIFFDLHRKSRRDKAEFMSKEMEAFFGDISMRFQERGWLDLSFIKVGGKEVAALFSFDFAGTEYVYNSGYDPQFAQLSPGIVLAAHCIRRAIDKGMHSFNFLRGREDYKYHLGGKEEKIFRLRVIKK